MHTWLDVFENGVLGNKQEHNLRKYTKTSAEMFTRRFFETELISRISAPYLNGHGEGEENGRRHVDGSFSQNTDQRRGHGLTHGQRDQSSFAAQYKKQCVRPDPIEKISVDLQIQVMCGCVCICVCRLVLGVSEGQYVRRLANASFSEVPQMPRYSPKNLSFSPRGALAE